MGGLGSGRRWDKKQTVDDTREIDINTMTRVGVFDDGRDRTWRLKWLDPWTDEVESSIGYRVDPYSDTMRLSYRLTDEGRHVEYEIRLLYTALPWGGVRWWFRCPLVCNGRSCGRRVAKLYMPSGADYFGCRHCYDLTYRSCQESGKFRALDARMAAACGIGAADIAAEAKAERRALREATKRAQRQQRRERRKRAQLGFARGDATGATSATPQSGSPG